MELFGVAREENNVAEGQQQEEGKWEKSVQPAWWGQTMRRNVNGEDR